MVRTKTVTEEQRKAALYKAQKRYRDKVMFHHHDYPNLEGCYKFAAKCLRWSVLFNAVLFVTTVLGRIF